MFILYTNTFYSSQKLIAVTTLTKRVDVVMIYILLYTSDRTIDVLMYKARIHQASRELPLYRRVPEMFVLIAATFCITRVVTVSLTDFSK